MVEWTTVWIILGERKDPSDPISKTWVWDAVKKEWVHKGRALLNALHEGSRFESREKAEEAALILATEQPEFFGKLRVEPYKL